MTPDNQAIPLLDHGLVRLVDHMGGDLSIVRSARVSYDAEWRAGADEGSDRKLINYLMKNRHTTPFESVQFTFEVKAPIFVFRQWHRHRTFSYNELSARYKELPAEYYVAELDQITTQSTDNKQMRTDEQHSMAATIREVIRTQSRQAHEVYHVLIKKGCPRELARSVLPVNTYSHMFCSVNLHNLFGFLRLRLHSHAQYEIRVYAEAMLKLIEPFVPVAVAAFKATMVEAEKWEAFKKTVQYSNALAAFELAQDPNRNK
jgi:thymidylate synthase (FAD)